MKTVMSVFLAAVCLTGLAWAAPAPGKKVPAFPGTLVNARYVYVASYDGDQFNPNLLPEDRQAIASVQDALQKWGKWVIVYSPREADIVLLVESRPSEDVLAVYDAHGFPDTEYLWRVMGRGGLQKNETPLVTELQQAFDKATK